MTNPLEAKVVIRADTTQAVAGVKALGKEASAIPGSVAPAGKALDTVGTKLEANTKRINDATRRLALLRPQITDIVTGLATGQSPFTILLQQGGQLGDVFGGFGNALKALGSVFTPLRLLAGGLAAGLGTVAFQAFQSQQQVDALQKNLALTGNVAGLSTPKLDAMAGSIANLLKVSTSTARESLAEVVAVGRFTGAAVLSVGTAVTALGKANGQAAAENVKLFTSLLDNTLAKTLALNQQYNFLNIEQLKVVQQLVAQGRQMEAAALVSEQFTQALQSRTVPTVTAYGKAWEKVKLALAGVVESTRDLLFGLEAPEKALERLRVRLADLQRKSGSNPGQSAREAQAALASQIALIEQRLQRDEQAAVDAADSKQKAIKEGLKLDKGYQDSLTAITTAGLRKRLAQELAAIDARKSAVEQDHAAGVIGERDFAARLNEIELERQLAQRAALKAQLDIESGKLVKGGETQEQNAQQARVLQLQEQLTTLDTQVAATRSKGITESIAAQRAAAIEAAQAYGEVWQRAAQQVASFAQSAAETSARLLADPAQRAKAEADAATAALRAQQAQTERDLGNRIAISKDPNQAAELQRQLDDLSANAKLVIAEADRAARLASFAAQAAEREARLATEEASVRQRVEQGLITEEQGEREILELRRQQLVKLREIADLMGAIARLPAEQNEASRVKAKVKELEDERTKLGKLARDTAVSGLKGALDDITTGAKTGKEALMDMVAGFAKAMLDVLNKRLAEQLVKQFTDAVGIGGGTGGGGFFGWLASVFSFHSGGVVGASGGPTRTVNPLAFALAPRYHGGGIAGLMPDEVPAVLRRGEEVLREDDPRHRRNGGGAPNINSTVNVSVTTDGVSSEQTGQFGQVLGRAVKATVHEVLIDQMRPGGILARR